MIMTIFEKQGNLFDDWGELIPESPLKYIDRNYWLNVEFNKKMKR